jgi:sugar lactone lactonase YvrE
VWLVDGPGSGATFASPQGLAWDEAAQALYVADGLSVRMVRCERSMYMARLLSVCSPRR